LVFATYFSLEVIVRFQAFKNKRDCFKSGWFKFDCFLAFMMLADFAVWGIVADGGSGHLGLLQALRLARLFKLFRLGRLLKALPELVTQLRALVQSVRAVYASLLLVFFLTYMWALLMHMLLKSSDELNAALAYDLDGLAFSTMTHCIWTLIVDGALTLDGAAPLMTTLLFSDNFNEVLAGTFFVLYLCTTNLVIMQMLIGVLCQVMVDVTQAEKDKRDGAQVYDRLLKELIEEDGDGDGSISRSELVTLVQDPKAMVLMQDLNINILFLVELSCILFPHESSAVTFDEFLHLLLACRGDTPATVSALAGGFTYVAKEFRVVLHDMKEAKATTNSEFASVLRDIDDFKANMKKELEILLDTSAELPTTASSTSI